MARRTRTVTRLGRAEKGWDGMLRAINRRADVKNEAHTRVEQGGAINDFRRSEDDVKYAKYNWLPAIQESDPKVWQVLWRERGNLSKALA
jgi:hypothetical protein